MLQCLNHPPTPHPLTFSPPHIHFHKNCIKFPNSDFCSPWLMRILNEISGKELGMFFFIFHFYFYVWFYFLPVAIIVFCISLFLGPIEEVWCHWSTNFLSWMCNFSFFFHFLFFFLLLFSLCKVMPDVLFRLLAIDVS